MTVLQRDLGVGYNPDRIHDPDFTDSRDLFIHGLLAGRRMGTCVSLPVLYAAVGRRLGYPIKLALTVTHVYNRWDAGVGGEVFNIEAAGRGMSVFPDEYYRQWPRPMTPADLGSGEYLRSLTAAEELACFLASRGHCLQDVGRVYEAAESYAHACRLSPRSLYYQAFFRDGQSRCRMTPSDHPPRHLI